MANRADFKETNPFAKMPSIQIESTSTKPPYVRRSSIARAAPKAPSTPPKLPNGTSNEKQLRQQMWRYENMYKQTKNQLEVLKMQFKSNEKELNVFKSQKRVIESNHSNIVLWQKKLAHLEMEKETLMDKNGLFLQQKNTYLLQLADAQQRNDEYRIEIDCKNAEIDKLESEMTHSSQNYTQQLSKKEHKYRVLKKEYDALHTQYTQNKDTNAAIREQLQVMASQFKQMKQKHTLTTHSAEKLQKEHDALSHQHKLLETEISQVKGDSTIAVQLAQKKDKNIIKDLRQTLKSETIKCQQYRAEYMELKDEVNDLRDWRETYLRTTYNNNDDTYNDDTVDNVSNTSSTSSKNSITIKNKLKILKTRSVNSIAHSFHDLLDDITPLPQVHHSNNAAIASKEHDEVIEVLSNRLVIVKENCVNMKQLLATKDNEIEKLHLELAKNKEMIADLIEKVNDKPLPPTPTEIADEQRVIRRRPKGPPPPLPPPPKVVMSPSYNKGIQHVHDHDIILKKVYKTAAYLTGNGVNENDKDDHDDDDIMLAYGDGI